MFIPVKVNVTKNARYKKPLSWVNGAVSSHGYTGKGKCYENNRRKKPLSWIKGAVSCYVYTGKGKCYEKS